MNDEELNNLFDDNEEIKKEEPAPKLDKPKKNRQVSELTNENKLVIAKFWEERLENPPSIEETAERVFPGQGLDGRSIESYWIKNYIINELKLGAPKTKTTYLPKGSLNLSPEFCEYIKNNPNQKPREIARILFNNPNLSSVCQETRTVLAYQKQLEEEGEFKREFVEDEVSEEYRPPKTLDHSCARINRNIDGLNFDSKKITPTQKKQALKLIDYLHSFRFAHHYNLINNAQDRALFENTFIKYIYDKTDLSQEDLDQYLALANEAVMESSIKRTIAILEEEQTRSLNQTNKISMTIVEAIKTSRDELNSCRSRHDKLYKALDVERSIKLKNEVKDKESLLSLFNTWKNYESRQQLLKIRQKDKENLRKEIQDIENMDELKQRVLGLSVNEIIDG